MSCGMARSQIWLNLEHGDAFVICIFQKKSVTSSTLLRHPGYSSAMSRRYTNIAFLTQLKGQLRGQSTLNSLKMKRGDPLNVLNLANTHKRRLWGRMN